MMNVGYMITDHTNKTRIQKQNNITIPKEKMYHHTPWHSLDTERFVSIIYLMAISSFTPCHSMCKCRKEETFILLKRDCKQIFRQFGAPFELRAKSPIQFRSTHNVLNFLNGLKAFYKFGNVHYQVLEYQDINLKQAGQQYRAW